MKITVEISEKELIEIQLYSGEKRKGPAVRKLALESLQLKKRRAMSDKIMSGEWNIDFPASVGKQEDRSSW